MSEDVLDQELKAFFAAPTATFTSALLDIDKYVSFLFVAGLITGNFLDDFDFTHFVFCACCFC